MHPLCWCHIYLFLLTPMAARKVNLFLGMHAHEPKYWPMPSAIVHMHLQIGESMSNYIKSSVYTCYHTKLHCVILFGHLYNYAVSLIWHISYQQLLADKGVL